MARTCLGPALMFLLASVIGCGAGISPTKVVVKEDGVPVDGATVIFEPDEPKMLSAAGTTNASGEAEMYTGQKRGASVGHYKVSIIKSPGGPGAPGGGPGGKPTDEKSYREQADKQRKSTSTKRTLLNERYSESAKSGLTATVPSTGPITFELKK